MSAHSVRERLFADYSPEILLCGQSPHGVASTFEGSEGAVTSRHEIQPRS
ncbi:hypothetical protein [Ereboglobus luteus]|nr:hypothetical protein [Ereboglobus luteus]